MGLKKKKVTWNAGQVSEKITTSRRRLPPYSPEPDVKDPDLRESWRTIEVGQALIILTESFSQPGSNLFPHPIVYPYPGGWSNENQFLPGHLAIYLGQTHVPMMGSKNRIISKPYHTVFFNGAKYLIHDPNMMKPITE